MEFVENISQYLSQLNLQGWFYVAVLVLAGAGALFFGLKMIFRLVLFLFCIWVLWWAATHLGLIDDITIKSYQERLSSEVNSLSVPKNEPSR